MFYLPLKMRGASPSQGQRSSGRLELETLEDRVVPSIANDTIIVPTLPSGSVSPPIVPAPPTGLYGVDPNYGTQTAISTGGVFVTPDTVVEAPGRIGLSVLAAQLYVADGTAGFNGKGAIIEYDPSYNTTRIVADSSNGGLMNDPVVLAFLYSGNYLYVANCTDRTLVRLDPYGWHQSYVTVLDNNGNDITHNVFTVVTDLKRVQGSTSALYLLDEGASINNPGQGQVWKLTFSDSLHAARSAFGPQFPSNDPSHPNTPDYSHPETLTRDLSNPSSVDPIVVSAAQYGYYDTLVLVHPSSLTVLGQDDPSTGTYYLKGGNGIVMGQGTLGSNTIFLSNIAYGYNPGYTVAVITAMTENGTMVTNHTALSTGNNLSSPGGTCIYQSSGGSAPAPGGPQSPVLPVTEDYGYNAGLIPQQTQLSAATTTPVPSAGPVVLLSQTIPPRAAEELTVGTARPEATHQVSVQHDAVDSFFADWASDRAHSTFSGALLLKESL
jgi:hypothetical protein